jgi:hypothetical protein
VCKNQTLTSLLRALLIFDQVDKEVKWLACYLKENESTTSYCSKVLGGACFHPSKKNEKNCNGSPFRITHSMTTKNTPVIRDRFKALWPHKQGARYHVRSGKIP